MSQSEMNGQAYNSLSPEERMVLKEKYEKKANFWMKILKFLISPVPMIMVIAIMNGVAIPFMIVAAFEVMSKHPNISGAFLTNEINDLFNSKYVLAVYCIYGIVAAIIFGLWYALAFVRKNPKKFNPLESISLSSIIMVPACALGVFGITEMFMVLLSIISPQAIQNYADKIANSGIIGFDGIIPIICMYIIAPVVEELAIRGVTTKLLKWAGLSTIAVLIWQAVYFGIMHLDPVQSSYTFFVGLILGYIAYKYDSIYLSILTHLAFNVIGTVTPMILEKIEATEPIQIGFFVLCILIMVGVYLIDRFVLRSDFWKKPLMDLFRGEKKEPLPETFANEEMM